MKLAKHIFTLIISGLLYHAVDAQGCVAIRNNGGTCTMTGHDEMSSPKSGSWTFAVNSRYFKSYKHFVGTEEQKQRVDEGTNVINHVFATELGVVRQVNPRWSLAVYTPIISNARSSLYEHDGKHRYSTHSFGVGDIRFAAYYWLVNPSQLSKANVQLGLGIKLPTGDYRYQDYFHTTDSTKRLGPVDQSIQLGDGGTGISLETNAFYRLNNKASVFVNGFYLSNPREQNAVSTARGGTTSASSVVYGSDVMSVPDQFMLRAGISYLADQVSFSGALRVEGVPAQDLIGGSNGFRRPGYVISAEPVVAYRVKTTQFYLSVPVAVQRNRTQSVPDMIKTEKTGIYSQGDAAFADYTINFGVAFSFK
jgi:hypothetical protein